MAASRQDDFSDNRTESPIWVERLESTGSCATIVRSMR